MGPKLTKYKARVLQASVTKTATFTGSTIDWPADYIGGKFYIDVSAASGTSPTLDVGIQTTYDDGTTWITCWRSAQITSAADREIQTFFGPNSTSDTDYHTERAALAVTGGALSLPTPVADKIRINFEIGGTSPSFTFAVYFIPWRVLPAGGF